MKLVLRPGAHVAMTEQGLSVAGREQAFVIPGGAELAEEWARLYPLLHNGIGKDQEAASKIVRLLRETGLLLEGPPAASDGFPRTLNYLQAWADDPAAALRTVRHTRVVVSGDGAIATGARRAAADLGFAAADSAPGDDGSGAPVRTIHIGGTDTRDVAVATTTHGVLISPGSEQSIDELLERVAAQVGAPVRTSEAPPPVAQLLAGGLAALQVLAQVADTPKRTHAQLIEPGTLSVRSFPVCDHTVRPITAPAPLPTARPTGTLAPVEYNFGGPPDPWLHAVTDPVTGVVRAGTRAEVADRARALVIDPPEKLWSLNDGTGCVPMRFTCKVMGYSPADIAADALRQLDVTSNDDPIAALHEMAEGHVAGARYAIDPVLDRELIAGWISFDPKTTGGVTL